MSLESEIRIIGVRCESDGTIRSGSLIGRGPQGAKGEKGEKGDTGPQGPQGEKGETGAQGPQGIQGAQGEKGDPGPAGPTGPKGDTGATPQISVQVQTGEAGSEASVSVSGTAEEPVIHLTIPRGDPGQNGNGSGTVTGVKVGSTTHEPDETGVVDLGDLSIYAPVRGTDYWTEDDIAQIKGYVDDAILGGAW